MSVNALIINALKPLGIPISFQMYLGKASTYITFFEFNQRAVLNADDAENKTEHSFQVDIWSEDDYTDLVQQVKEKMLAIGFRRTTETEIYETDAKIYHKVIRFNFVQ